MKVYYLALVIFGVLTDTYEAARWSGQPLNNRDLILQACVGHDVILPWTYLVMPQDVIHMITWYFNNEMVAVYNEQLFLTEAKYFGRVDRIKVPYSHHNVSQLLIKNVTKDDAGVYGIQIKGSSSPDPPFTLRKTLTLNVADELVTKDHQLDLKVSTTRNTFGSQRTLTLYCGTFKNVQKAYFDVQWVTPSNKTLNSTGFRDGVFSLALSPYPEQGRYTCLLPKNTPEVCLKESMAAIINVQPTITKMPVLEPKPGTTPKPGVGSVGSQGSSQSANYQLPDEFTAQLVRDQNKIQNKQLRDEMETGILLLAIQTKITINNMLNKINNEIQKLMEETVNANGNAHNGMRH